MSTSYNPTSKDTNFYFKAPGGKIVMLKLKDFNSEVSRNPKASVFGVKYAQKNLAEDPFFGKEKLSSADTAMATCPNC